MFNFVKLIVIAKHIKKNTFTVELLIKKTKEFTKWITKGNF